MTLPFENIEWPAFPLSVVTMNEQQVARNYGIADLKSIDRLGGDAEQADLAGNGVDQFSDGCCYLRIVKPEYRELAKVQCGSWPMLREIYSLPAVWIDDLAFMCQLRQVGGGYYHVVASHERVYPNMFQVLAVLFPGDNAWPDLSFGAAVTSRLRCNGDIVLNGVSLQDRVGGQIAEAALVPPVLPASVVGESGVTESMVLAYYSAYVKYMELSTQVRIGGSDDGTVSVDGISLGSSLASPCGSVSQNSSVSSGKARRRAKRRMRRAAIRKRVLEASSEVTYAASDTASNVSAVTFSAGSAYGRDSSGFCYMSLLKSGQDIGANPTFRQLLELPPSAYLPNHVLAKFMVSRVAPGVYHLCERGVSALHTLACLARLMPYGGMAGQLVDVAYPSCLDGKVKLDDVLGAGAGSSNDCSSKLGDSLIEYAQSVVRPTRKTPELPEVYHDADDGMCYLIAVLPQFKDRAVELLGSRPTFSAVLSAKYDWFKSIKDLETIKLERTAKLQDCDLFHCVSFGPSLLLTLSALAAQHTYPVGSLGDRLLDNRETVDLRYRSYVRAADRLGA